MPVKFSRVEYSDLQDKVDVKVATNDSSLVVIEFKTTNHECAALFVDKKKARQALKDIETQLDDLGIP